jgi:hypothetical protein
VHTLWGSFEIKNDVLAVKMLQQHTKKNLKGCSDAVFDEAADSFQRLPMWYMTFYGSTQIEQARLFFPPAQNAIFFDVFIRTCVARLRYHHCM